MTKRIPAYSSEVREQAIALQVAEGLSLVGGAGDARAEIVKRVEAIDALAGETVASRCGVGTTRRAILALGSMTMSEEAVAAEAADRPYEGRRLTLTPQEKPRESRRGRADAV